MGMTSGPKSATISVWARLGFDGRTGTTDLEPELNNLRESASYLLLERAQEATLVPAELQESDWAKARVARREAITMKRIMNVIWSDL